MLSAIARMGAAYIDHYLPAIQEAGSFDVTTGPRPRWAHAPRSGSGLRVDIGWPDSVSREALHADSELKVLGRGVRYIC